MLREFLPEVRSAESDPAEAFLFTNVRGHPMTRFGVRYLLRKYVAAASRSVTTLRDKHIHPHSLRHSTAVALLKAGVDFATISQWLGLASLNATMRYARADLDLKRQALAQVFPETPWRHRAAGTCSSTAATSSDGCVGCSSDISRIPNQLAG